MKKKYILIILTFIFLLSPNILINAQVKNIKSNTKYISATNKNEKGTKVKRIERVRINNSNASSPAPSIVNYGSKRILNIVEFNKKRQQEFTYRKANTIVANIAPTKDSGGGQLWSGPHGHYFDGSINSKKNPIDSLVWWLQTNKLVPLSLSYHEGWKGTYGSGQYIVQGHEGIDVAYKGNTKIVLAEDSWVSEIWANGNLKEVIVVKSEKNTHEPVVDKNSGVSYFFGIGHSSYVNSSVVQQKVNNIPLIYNAKNVINVYEKEWKMAQYINPVTLNSETIKIRSGQPVILGKNNGHYLAFSYDKSLRATVGYISKWSYDKILQNSTPSTFNNIIQKYNNSNNIYHIKAHWRKDSTGHWVYITSKNILRLRNKGWEKYYSHWMYSLGNGQYTTNQWKKINSKWYHFDHNGYITMNTGWEKYHNRWMYSNYSSGYYTSQWKKIKNIWYLFDNNGYIMNYIGWYKYSNKWMYSNGNYGFATNHSQKINNKWYHFNNNGYIK